MKIIRQLLFILMSSAILSSCLKEEDKLEATAIMTDIASLEFGVDEELTKALTVYADAPWTVDCPEWITVDPATGGAGETMVSVTAAPNIREQLPDRPRKAVIVFRGQDMYADASVDILQNGDKYRDLVDGTLADAFAQKVETFVGVKDVQVVAVANEGYVVKDETGISYVEGTQVVEVGDQGSVYAYVSSLNGLPSLTDADKFVKSGNATVDYSGIKDITSTLQEYVPESPELVSIKGKFASNKIELYYDEGQERPLEPDSVKVEILNPHSSLNVTDYDGWLVEAKGYAFGNSSNIVYVVPVSIEGIKAIEKIYFADDFSWLSPWSSVDAVGNDDQGTSVTNVWKATWADEFFAGFKEKGYQYLWATLGDTEFKPGPELVANGGVGKDGSLYVCKDYLKFGQTDYNAALRLPALSAIEGEVNIKIDFDWCWQVTGSNNADIMTVSVESNVGKFEQTGIPVSQKLESAQSTENGSSHLAWQHASVILTGATAETVLTIRPTNADPSKSNPSRKQNRWYLDNIKIIRYEGSVSVAEPTEAEMTISMENTMTFEAAQTEPISFEFVSDQEAVLTAGADWMYFLGADDAQLSSLTIPAATTTVVKVGCLENTKSETRKTEITIESGLSKETIPVTQVSPGVKLEPFISLVGGNSGKVSFDEGSFNVSVQTNVEYEISSDAAWVTVEEIPETRALVDVKQYVVKYQANADPAERVAHIRVFNAENNLETVYTLTQAAFVTGVYFQDDFTWVAPWADAYGSADSVGDNDHSGKAPNVYTQATQTGFLDEFAKRGYLDLNPDGQVVYTQKYYLKFGKTNVNTGITLPQNNFEGDTPVDVDITFDWCAHMITKEPYTFDKVQMVVELTGPGVCADSKGKVSNAYDTKQTNGNMSWQKFAVRLNGVTKDTRISIRPLNWDKTETDGAEYKVQRYHIDNIKIEKSEAVDTDVVFEDDFEWIAPIAAQEVEKPIGDAVGTNNASAQATNVWKLVDSKGFFDKFNELGYKYTYATTGDTEFKAGPAQEANPEVGKEGSMYIQTNYLKFGQTDYNAALTLPALSSINGVSNISIEFDWCWQVTGANKPDLMTLSVDASVGQFAGSGSSTSQPLESTQSKVDGESYLAWQHVTIVLNDATAETVLTIRPTAADPSILNSVRRQNRWYLDNIKISLVK